METYRFTGNPFVDTGLCVAAAMLGIQDAGSITLNDLKQIIEDSKLASYNSRLKSFTMIFGTNGPLKQDQYKNIDRCDLYTRILVNLAMPDQRLKPDICELCGINHAVDVTNAFQSALNEFGLKSTGVKEIGRDLVPMSGSPGNSAQSLPGSVKPVQICPRCLLAMNFLPLGSMLIAGKLITLECANQPLAKKFIRGILNENLSSLKAGDSKVEVLGSHKSPSSVINKIIDLFENLDPDEEGAVIYPLFVWLYTNSGTGTDCSHMIIPGHMVKFLWEARGRGYRNDIKELLKYDSKIYSENQLLPSIQSRRPYVGLFPGKKYPGSSIAFAEFYLNRICGIKPDAFAAARLIAKRLLESGHDVKTMKKTDSVKDPSVRSAVRKMVADMAENGEIDISIYDSLFPTTSRHPIRVDGRGWNILQLFLCKFDEKDSDALEVDQVMRTVHPKIDEASQLYFQDYVADRGIDRFKRDVLDRFSRNVLGVDWLRNVFSMLAEKYPGFDYGDWDEFVCDNNGIPQARELLFQMRIRLANLYREYINNKEAVK